MSAVMKMSVTAAPVASFAGARRSSAAVARRSTIAHFKVTLETPEGAQAIECADDTYILDAAEVRRRRRENFCSSVRDARGRARGVARARTGENRVARRRRIDAIERSSEPIGASGASGARIRTSARRGTDGV